MGIRGWLGRAFRFGQADDDAAVREEYGLPAPGGEELGRDPLLAFAGGDAADLAAADLEALKPPPDPA
jgi:hypothetical protein